MPLYDYKTIKKYHEKQVSICQCANSLQKLYETTCAREHIKEDKLEKFETLAKPVWITANTINGIAFSKGKSTNLATMKNLSSELILHGYASNMAVLTLFGSLSAKIDALIIRENRNQERLSRILQLGEDTLYEVEDNNTNRTGISYIHRYILKK